jgi:hypothetical protein
VSFAAITLCVASQRVFIAVVVYFVMTQSGNFGYTLTCEKELKDASDTKMGISSNFLTREDKNKNERGLVASITLIHCFISVE